MRATTTGDKGEQHRAFEKIKRCNPSTVVVMIEDLPHTANQNDFLILGAEFFIDPSRNLDQWVKVIEGLL